MLYRLWSIQQQIRWCNFALSTNPKRDTVLRLYRLNKREQLRKAEMEVLLQIAERRHLVNLLVANEIDFIIIDEQIVLL
jgi:Ser/Thr protein kinase RdoA (MazF antagonist)